MPNDANSGSLAANVPMTNLENNQSGDVELTSVVSQTEETAVEAAIVPEMLFGDWAVNNGALYKREKEVDYRLVTSTPPWIVASVEDVDTGIVKSQVTLKINGREQTITVDRDQLFSVTGIVKVLSQLGANISGANARDVVQFLTEYEATQGHQIECKEGVSHLGWSDDKCQSFVPFDQDESGTVFCPPPDMTGRAKPFTSPKGDLTKWAEGLRDARENSFALRAMLGASFASPLVRLLGVQPFMYYQWGRSGSGKTAALKAAASVWGNPVEGPDSYYRTFADSPKSIIAHAAFLHDLPVCIDELQSKGAFGGQAGKRQATEDLIYSLSLGAERSGLNSDRTMMHAGSWRSITIATGEIPVIGANTQQGARNRTVEINGEPFSDRWQAHEVHQLVARNYGIAGRAFIEMLLGQDNLALEKGWIGFRDIVREKAAGLPQADSIALICFADMLAELEIFKSSSGQEEASAKAFELCDWLLASMKRKQESDTDLEAVQLIQEWMFLNRSMFVVGVLTGENASDCYGTIEDTADGRVWNILSTPLREALERKGYDYSKTLKRMGEEGILKTANRGNTMQVRMGGQRMQCVVIKEAELERFLNQAYMDEDALAQHKMSA